MYIARLSITNYRCFPRAAIEFREGLTVIIGENNAGKTSLLRAIALVLERGNRSRPTVDDFAQSIQPSTTPPRLSVTLTLKSSEGDTQMDRALVATWLTKMAAPWEAQLTYEFFLPAEHDAEFKKYTGNTPSQKEFRFALERLLPKYISRLWAGNPSEQRRAEPELVDKIAFELLGALRDVESEMFRGRNALLRSVLHDALDRHPEHRKNAEVSRMAFDNASASLVDSLLDRLDQSSLFSLVAETGAQDGGNPTLGGSLGERDVLAALILLLKKQGFSIPASHSGLGYNNLIYVALILAQIEFATSDQQGQNAPVFPILAIEEPEAHLHPSMQYKLQRYLKRRLDDHKVSRQIFITTHSTHVTAATPLDNLLCLSLTAEGAAHVSYPGKTFPDTDEGRRSKAYVERYLDGTKSEMLFAKSVIFVEGLAETLLVPTLAEYLQSSLEEHHVALIAVGGLTFSHFLPLFGCGNNPLYPDAALRRRVACLVDADPSRREQSPRTRWTSCLHYQINRTPTAYEYRAISPTAETLTTLMRTSPHLHVSLGKQTFEYDLALSNVESSLLVPSTAPTSSVHSPAPTTARSLPDLSDELEADVIAATEPGLSVEAMHFASRYHQLVSDKKGAHAFELNRRLRDNLAKPAEERVTFTVPTYVESAIRWACCTNPLPSSP